MWMKKHLSLRRFLMWTVYLCGTHSTTSTCMYINRCVYTYLSSNFTSMWPTLAGHFTLMIMTIRVQSIETLPLSPNLMPPPNRARRRTHKPEANGASDSGTVEQKQGKKLSDSHRNRARLGVRKPKVNGPSDSGCSIKLPDRVRRNARKQSVNKVSNSGSVERRKRLEKELSDEEVSKIWTWLASQHAEADHKLERIATRGLLFPSRTLYSTRGAKEYGHRSPVGCVESENDLALDYSGRVEIEEAVKNAEGLLNSNSSTTFEKNIGDFAPERYDLMERGGENLSPLDGNKKNSHTVAVEKRLSVKLHARARHRSLTAGDVTSLFLPPGTTSPGEHAILLSEVLEVFEKDLGIFPTDKEREYILDSFGLGERMVDVEELLHSCGMWHPNKLENPSSLELNLDEAAPALQNGRPCLDFSSSEENSNAAAVEREIEGTTYCHLSRLGRAPCIQRKDGEMSISSTKTEKGVENTSMDENEERNLLIVENEDLRQELSAAFDMKVFDELEDLKFVYSNLKKNMDGGKGEGGFRHQKNNSIYLDNSMEYRSVDDILQSADQTKVASIPCVVESPVRGARGIHHISQREKQWEGGDTSPSLVAEAERKNHSSSNRGERKKRSSLTQQQQQNECCNNNEAAIAFHDFKLAWEVVSGGMPALEEFHKSIIKLVHEGHAYLTTGLAVGALNKASYLLNDWDINDLKMGMETNEKGDLNAKELLQMIEDIAIHSSWYTNVCDISLDDDRLSPSISLYPEKGIACYPWNSKGSSSLNEDYLPENEHFKDDNKGMDCCFVALTIEDVITKVRQQLGLINLSAFNGSTLAEQLEGAFYRRDRFLTGTLSLPEARCAMEELGMKLGEDELSILARRFQQPLQPNDEEVLPTEEVLTYTPLLQWLSRELCRRKMGMLDKKEYKIPLARKGRSEKKKWYYKLCSSRLASKLRLVANSVEFSGEFDNRRHQEWANKLRKRFDDFDVASSGKISRRDFLHILEIEGFALSKNEKKLVASILDFNHDGSVHWKEFVEFFENDEVGMAATAYGEPWYATQVDVVDKIITMTQQQQQSDRRGKDYSGQHYSELLLTLQQKFESYDITMTGYVKWEEFAASFKDCCSLNLNLNLNLEPFELKRLFLALDKHGEGQANYKDLLDFLVWWRKCGKWYKIEPAIAGNILKAMGIGPMQRYSWLSRLKKKFYEIDHSRIGVVCEKNFLETLKECGVHFTSQPEQRRLLNILIETNKNKDSVSKSLKADVPYGEVIAFCARHAGYWQDAYPLLVDQIKDAMLKRAANSCCSEPIWCIFSQFDKSGSGAIREKDFGSALHQLGLGDLSFSDRSVITEIVVDQHESRAISYAGVVRALAEFDPLYKTDQALAVKLLGVLGECLGSRSVFCPEFYECERVDTKLITPATRKEHLKKAVSKIVAAHRGGLTEKELERLVICVDSSNSNNSDIFVSACKLLNMFVSGHLGAWVERLPCIATDLAFQFGLLPSDLTAVSNMKRLLRIADRGGKTGKCGPVAFKRCLNSTGLDLSDVEINDIMRVTADTVGGGDYVAYEVIVNFLCNMCNSTSDFETPNNEAAAPLVKHLLEEFREGVQNALLQDGGRRSNLGSKASYQSLRRWVVVCGLWSWPIPFLCLVLTVRSSLSIYTGCSTGKDCNTLCRNWELG